MRQTARYRFFYQDEFYPVGCNIDHLRLHPDQCLGISDLIHESSALCHEYGDILRQDDAHKSTGHAPAGTPNLTDEERSWCHDRIEQARQRLDDLYAIQRAGLSGIIVHHPLSQWHHISEEIHEHRKIIDLFNMMPLGADDDLLHRFVIAHQQWDQSGGWANLRRDGGGRQAGADMARLIRVIDCFCPNARQTLNHQHSRQADESRHYAERLIELGQLPAAFPLHDGSPYRDMIDQEDEGSQSSSSGGNRFPSSMEALRLDLDMRDISALPASFLDNPLEAKRYLEAIQYDAFVASLKPRNPAPISEVRPDHMLKVDAILKVKDPLFRPRANADGLVISPEPQQWWHRKLTPN